MRRWNKHWEEVDHGAAEKYAARHFPIMPPSSDHIHPTVNRISTRASKINAAGSERRQDSPIESRASSPAVDRGTAASHLTTIACVSFQQRCQFCLVGTITARWNGFGDARRLGCFPRRKKREGSSNSTTLVVYESTSACGLCSSLASRQMAAGCQPSRDDWTNAQ